jgi:hypothetical protein
MTRVCSIEGCGKPHSDNDLCSTHARRLRLWGDARPDIPVVGRGNKEWLIAHVGHADEEACLIWPFGKSQAGYGKTKAKFDGKVYLYAHIAMCALRHGPMPEPKMLATHSCGNGHLGCVNPNHLRWGTSLSNAQDTVLHGRTNRGERSPLAKLSESDVRAIRAMRDQKTFKQIAKEYSVDPSTISLVMAGKNWGWLS